MYLGVSLTLFLDAIDPALNPPEYLVEYSQFLKECYIQHFTSLQDDEWPPMDTSRQVFSNLAIIKWEQTPDSKPHDYVHGDIDSIVAIKEPIELDHIVLPIFNESTTSSNFTVLLEGAPGVGKTTVLKKICLDWANGKILQEYKLVIFYSLRDIEHSNLDLVTLLHPPKSKAKNVADYLEEIKISGQYCLFLLDGYDELSDENRSKKSALVNQIITGTILGNCSVVVSSRPYASSRLRRHSRINRRVEVLGFTREQIVHHINNSISSEYDSKALIQSLDNRLDILSLCYIPLNCNIVLFVYKQKGNKVPATLTELYDTFILHTIKRSAIKQQSLESEAEQIEEANEINELPEFLLKRLDLLCKVAFCCLEKDQLSVSTKELTSDVDGILSLGLLSSMQFMNEKSIVKRYQFLHLTIQEFLAARYLTFQHIEKYNFFTSNIDKVRFRLTFMFLAGLTHLDFVPSGNYLLENVLFIKKTRSELLLDYSSSELELYMDTEYGELWEPEDTERIEQWNIFLLHAQMFYESQRTSFKNLFSFQSDSFKIDELTLSKFDSFAIAHLLSCIPKDFVWKVIDLTYIDIPLDSILYKKHLFANPNEVCLRKTNQLLLHDVPFSFILSVLDQNIWLTDLQFNCDELNHLNFYKLCAVIAKNKWLQNLCINNNYMDRKSKTVISKQAITIYGTKDVCSASLIQLSHFLNARSLEHFNIAGNKYAFTDCEFCGTRGIEAVKAFGKSIGESLQSIDLHDCIISLEIINALVSMLLTTGLKKLNVSGIDFNSGFGTLPQLLSRGIVIIIHNLKLEPVNSQEVIIDIVDKYSFDIDLEKLLNQLILPQEFTRLTCRVSHSHKIKAVSNFLHQNSQLIDATFSTSIDAVIDVTCSGLAKLVETIIHHPSLESFSGFDLEHSKEVLSFLFRCSKLAVTLLTHVDHVKLNSITVSYLYDCMCDSSSILVAEKLSETLVLCKALKKLDMTDCDLSETSVSIIVEAISDCNLNTIDHIILSGNFIGSQNLSKLLSLLIAHPQIRLNVYGLSLKVESHLLKVFQYEVDNKANEFLCLLKLPCDINGVEFIEVYGADENLHCDTLMLFLTVNTSLIHVKFSRVEKLSCNQSYKLSQSILNHPMLENISFKVGIYDILLSPSHLQCKENICPSTLNNLLKFLKPENLEIFDISGNKNIFNRCSYCNDDSGDTVFATFLHIISKCNRLTDIDMSSCFFPGETVTRLIYSLKHSKNLKNVTLNENGISHPTIKVISTMIFFGNLEKFVSSEFQIFVQNRPNFSMEIKFRNSEHFSAIFPACTFENKLLQLKNLSIESELSNNVDKCKFTTSAVINDILNVTPLEQLHLTRIFLGNPQMFITIAVESCYLQDLSLVSASLDSSIVILLLDKLTKNKILKNLSIAQNSLIDLHIKLGKSFQKLFQSNKCLESLNLSDCHLSLSVFKHIALGLSQNQTLKTLDISRHNFQNGEFIRQILEENHSIKILKMSYCICSEVILFHIGQGLKVNSTLEEIYLEAQDDVFFQMHCISDAGWVLFFKPLQHNTTLHTMALGAIYLDSKAKEELNKLTTMKTSLNVIKNDIRIVEIPDFMLSATDNLFYGPVSDKITFDIP